MARLEQNNQKGRGQMPPVSKMLIIHAQVTQEVSDHYNIIKRLGQGTFGKVLLAQDKKTGEPVAIKLVRKDRIALKDFVKELSISISLSGYHGIIATYPMFYNTMDYYIMTQELATAGTLHHLIKAKVGIPEDAVKRCAAQLSTALDYVHGRGLVHMDLKPDNVFLMDRDCYNIKLGDFGLTRKAGSFVSSKSNIIPYMSPEMCDVKQNEFLILSPSVDTWALGVLLYIALTGYMPWKKAVEMDTRYQVYMHWQKHVGLIPPPVFWQKFTREALDMFNNLLSRNCSARPSVLCVLNYLHYPWKIQHHY
ncbi:serine/threonine-protein kinase SBK1-like [Pseudophryne corroboree]|uniref:serine/threonine-protein kinase SBK1-like n=1 Tax=Pseudophryne corroboree TaxID=495146 RepID=UPI003081B498